ncbi:MAG TPA: hypothetical protein PKO15_17355 [Fibrobacteria bacterium]|nr:hypothetical protein [Fibrobacteria bacterium]HOX51573.1 hypothetical protein [Fibrobacteria bacterium]
MPIATRTCRTLLAIAALLALSTCQSSEDSPSVAAPGDKTPLATAAETWSLEGILQFPSKETAKHLKIVATTDYLSHSANRMASLPVSLVPAGSTPVASFRLDIDPRLATGEANPASIRLMIFQDANENGVNDFGEAMRQVVANAGSALWCDEGQPCSAGATFMRVSSTVTGTGAKGAYTISVPGWYYQKGCSDFSCAQLLVAPATHQGLIFGYSYYNTAPIDTTAP